MNADQLFLEIAEACARQSTCLRRRFGAVIVNSERQVLATGFNGSPKGMPHCDECNNCLRDMLKIPEGERFELCTSIHAEMNALLQSGRQSNGCVLYLYGYDVKGMREIIPKPCFLCTKMMINAGVTKVISRNVLYDPLDLYNAYLANLYSSNQHYP